MVFAFIILVGRYEPETQSNVFCAYGKVFVEFEEGSRKWGTILLNESGKPIQCQEPIGSPAIALDKTVSI